MDQVLQHALLLDDPTLFNDPSEYALSEIFEVETPGVVN
jgi:hypothetical protein